MDKKSVLITGGARGIGEQIAQKFAQNGYNVLINYNKSEDKAIELKSKINQSFNGIKCEIYKADVSSRNEVNDMIKYMIKNFNRIDILVNNAGIAKSKIFNDITEEEFQDMIDVNLMGIFNVTQETLNSYMINSKCGSIINISSIWGITGASMEVLYSTSKAGVIGMSKALAKELGPSNIRVNVVAPGWIDTDMTKDYNEEEKSLFISDIPLGRVGTAEDVANLVYFLGTNKSNYITGQVISPNGGYLI